MSGVHIALAKAKKEINRLRTLLDHHTICYNCGERWADHTHDGDCEVIE